MKEGFFQYPAEEFKLLLVKMLGRVFGKEKRAHSIIGNEIQIWPLNGFWPTRKEGLCKHTHANVFDCYKKKIQVVVTFKVTWISPSHPGYLEKVEKQTVDVSKISEEYLRGI